VSTNLYPPVTDPAAHSETRADVPGESAYNPASTATLLALDSLLDRATPNTPILAEDTASAAATGSNALTGSRRGARLTFMLVLADVLALTLAFASGRAIFGHGPWNLGWVSLAAVVVLCLGARSSGLHERNDGLLRKTTLAEVPGLFQLATLCVLVSWLTAQTLDRRIPHPSDVLELWLALSLLIVVTRSAVRWVDVRLSPLERCVFIGDEQAERGFCSKLGNHEGRNATVVARIDLEDFQADRLEDGLPGAVADIRHLARVLGVQRAVVAPHGHEAREVHDLVHILQAAGMKINVLPGRHDILGPSIAFDELDGMAIMSLRHFEMSRSSALLKRIFDIALTLIALLATFPVMLAIALAIKLDSRGPVFFSQFRVGRGGLGFQMLKFRTMVRDAESLKSSLADRNQASAGLFKINGDPRVTRVGRFLRKTSLDELPQMLNVLRGDMSLVGPRPLIPEEDRRMEGRQRRRLELLPGITGPWQILGPVRVSLEEMANIDNRYLLDRSMWTDVTILLGTLGHIAGRRGL
jgi:exopolysaccharide biosynthesis polyprenyl glycosylphosphotransferase